MKRFLISLLSLLLLCSLCACNGTNYASDRKVSDLIADAESALAGSDAYRRQEDDLLADYFTLPDYVTGVEYRLSKDGNNIDEFGIYQVTDGNAKALKKLVEGYLSKSYEQNQAYYDSYNPQQTPKLRDAEVKVFGNYVAYAILSDADRATFFDTVEKALIQE